MADRVAVLFEYPTLNGGERSMLQCLERITLSEFEVIAVAPAVGRLADELKRRNIELFPIAWRDAGGSKLPRARLSTLFLEAMHQIAPTLVHANSLSLGRLTGSVSDTLTSPTVAHIRDIIRLSKAAVADLNRNSRLVAVSAATRDFHLAQGFEAARTQVIYNGVDCEQFGPSTVALNFRRELQLEADSFVVVTIGQIGLRKAQDVLAAAAPQVVKRIENIHFVIVGERNSEKTESVEFERKLSEDFAEADIGDRLHRVGYRDDVPAILAESDLLVHPAKQEPLGRVLLEAAAAGTPIVATAVGGTVEILEDGVSARLVPPADPAALAAGIIELATNAATRRRFAAAAQQQVAENFRVDIAVQNLRALWRSLI